ncbi:MAG: hypothetical protein ACREM6_12885 [Vulcanimicrobiaceae bacterium]
MTDDELERALFSLPLEEPPEHLRRAIFASTVESPRLFSSPREIAGFAATVLVSLLLATLVMLHIEALTNGAGFAAEYLARYFSNPTNLAWLAVGISLAGSLTFADLFPARVRRSA